MANWSNPVLTSTYTNFVTEVKDRDVDLALQFDGVTPTNLPTGAIRWSSSANRWQKWSGTAWGELTTTYALTGLSTTGNATVGGTLGVTGAATFSAGGTSTTPATADNSTAIATTAYVKAQAYASLSSPTFTGTPAAPTAAVSTNTTQLATTAFTLAQIANDAVLKSGGTMTGVLTLSQDPTTDLHAVTKRWVESLASKQACRVATTANITLSGTQTVDGIALSIGDRVLVKDQTATAENGIYLVAAGAWTRASDADTWNDLIAARVTVAQGTANDNTFWLSTTATGGALGTTAVTWQVISNPQVAAIGTVSTNGLITRTGSGTAAARSIAVSGTGLTVSNADGASGNPTVISNATSDGPTADTIISRGTNGDFTAGTATLTSFSYTGNPTTTSTGAIQLPQGTTAQRPTAATGHVRFNSSLSQFEGYNGAAWGKIGGGATGGGADDVFVENGQTVTTSYTLTSGKNAMSAGPVTVNSGVTVTIPSGASWVIV